MNEYRCTRNQPYVNPKCFGFTDLAARQGYYLTAESEQEAIALMEQQFPDDTLGFTATLWKIDCRVCRGTGQQIPRTRMFDGSVQVGDPVTCDLCQGAGRVEVSEVEAYEERFV